jgi:hypothetical protein
MKQPLKIASLLVVLATVTYWAATGLNLGWSKTSVPITVLDEITGIEGVTYADKFVPGVDFLGVGLALAAVLTAVSFLSKTKPTKTSTTQHPKT